MPKISLRAYNREISNLIDRGQTDEAVAHCQYILQTYPKHLETYRLLGKAYLESHQYAEAIDIFQRVLAVVPDDFITHVGMSIIRNDENNLDAAIWHMERAFEVQPSNQAIQDELKHLYGKRDGQEPSKIRLTRGALCRMYARGNQTRQAIAEIKSILTETPDRVDIEVLLARMYYLSNMTNEAVDLVGKLLEKLPYCYDSNKLMIEILTNAKKSKEIDPYRQKIIALDPYESMISDPGSSLDQVPEDAITVDKLYFDPATRPSPAARRQVKQEVQESDEVAPDWLVSDLTGVEDLGSQGFTRILDASVVANEPQAETPASETQPVSTEAAAEEPLPSWLQDAAQETQAAQPAPAKDIPDFLSATGWAAAGTIDEGTPPSEVYPAEEPAAPEGEISPGEIPDWLQTLAPEQSVEEQPAQKEDEFSSWLSKLDETPESLQQTGILSDESLAQQPATTGILPDWLEEPVESPAAEVKPSKPLPPSSPPVETAAPPATKEPQIRQPKPTGALKFAVDENFPISGGTTILSPDDVPDWLQDLQPAEGESKTSKEDIFSSTASLTPSEPVHAGVPQEQTTTQLSPDEKNEIPDWLKDIQGESSGEIPPVEPSEELPQEAATMKLTSEEKVEMPSWLSEFSEEMPTESEAAEPETKDERITATLPESEREEVEQMPEWLHMLEQEGPEVSTEPVSEFSAPTMADLGTPEVEQKPAEELTAFDFLVEEEKPAEIPGAEIPTEQAISQEEPVIEMPVEEEVVVEAPVIDMQFGQEEVSQVEIPAIEALDIEPQIVAQEEVKAEEPVIEQISEQPVPVQEYPEEVVSSEAPVIEFPVSEQPIEEVPVIEIPTSESSETILDFANPDIITPTEEVVPEAETIEDKPTTSILPPNPEEAAEELPEWLREIDSGLTEGSSPVEVPESAAEAGEFPDWLKSYPTPTAVEPPLASAEPNIEQPISDEIPNWLQNMDELQATDQDTNLPDWLTDMEAGLAVEGVTSEQPAASTIPEWLEETVQPDKPAEPQTTEVPLATEGPVLEEVSPTEEPVVIIQPEVPSLKVEEPEISGIPEATEPEVSFEPLEQPKLEEEPVVLTKPSWIPEEDTTEQKPTPSDYEMRVLRGTQALSFEETPETADYAVPPDSILADESAAAAAAAIGIPLFAQASGGTEGLGPLEEEATHDTVEPVEETVPEEPVSEAEPVSGTVAEEVVAEEQIIEPVAEEMITEEQVVESVVEEVAVEAQEPILEAAIEEEAARVELVEEMAIETVAEVEPEISTVETVENEMQVLEEAAIQEEQAPEAIAVEEEAPAIAEVVPEKVEELEVEEAEAVSPVAEAQPEKVEALVEEEVEEIVEAAPEAAPEAAVEEISTQQAVESAIDELFVAVPAEQLPEEEPEPAPEKIQVSAPVTGKKPASKPIDFDSVFNTARKSLAKGDLIKAQDNLTVLIQAETQLDAVIQEVLSAIDNNPVDFGLWMTLGDAYGRNGNLQKALDAYTKAEEYLQ